LLRHCLADHTNLSDYDRRLHVRRLHDPTEFLSVADALLLADEPRHNLILGIAGTLRDHPGVFREHRLWLVESHGGVVLAALQTPPFNITLSRPLDCGALGLLAGHIAGEGVVLPGVTAAVPEADEFAEAWGRLKQVPVQKRMAQGVYRLSRVRPVTGVLGRPREATRDDRELLVAWLKAFGDEALPPDSPTRPTAAMVAARLDAGTGGFTFWEDEGRPVSLAGWGGETPNGVRIGPVYTPPEHRRRGYASAVTAAVSAERLAAGRRFCFLYTDLANATSNRIYVDVGYEAVCESHDYAFDSPADT
jgi:GNAT superfamily N-acetyltransferase